MQPIIHFNISTNTFFAIHEFFAADTGKEEGGLGNLLGLIINCNREIQRDDSISPELWIEKASSTTHGVNTKSRSMLIARISSFFFYQTCCGWKSSSFRQLKPEPGMARVARMQRLTKSWWTPPFVTISYVNASMPNFSSVFHHNFYFFLERNQIPERERFF